MTCVGCDLDWPAYAGATLNQLLLARTAHTWCQSVSATIVSMVHIQDARAARFVTSNYAGSVVADVALEIVTKVELLDMEFFDALEGLLQVLDFQRTKHTPATVDAIESFVRERIGQAVREAVVQG